MTDTGDTMTPAYCNAEIPRDRYGRPMIMPAGRGTKRIPYRRTTTFVGCLDDMNGLMKWQSRQVAYGMGQRNDLVLAAAAANPDDKKLLGDIAEKAKAAAKSSAAADIGTALHSLTERIDRGEPLGTIPAEYRADIDAYRKATQHITWHGIEVFRVHDEWQIAGTADRLGVFPGSDMLRIFDIKTGSVDYPHKMAMQLAMYARMTPYDIATDTRTTDPKPVDLNTGIIIHLPAGKGECTLHEIDIAKGWGACLLARKVWNWRAVKGLTHAIGDERTSTWEISTRHNDKCDPEMLIANADTLDGLRAVWKTLQDADLLTPALKLVAQRRSKELK